MRLAAELRHLKQAHSNVQEHFATISSVPDCWETRQALETLGTLVVRLSNILGVVEGKLNGQGPNISEH